MICYANSNYLESKFWDTSWVNLISNQLAPRFVQQHIQMSVFKRTKVSRENQRKYMKDSDRKREILFMSYSSSFQTLYNVYYPLANC